MPFETFTVYYQIHLLALQQQFAMFMQKMEKKRKKRKKRIKWVLQYCIVFCVLLLMLQNQIALGAGFFLANALLNTGCEQGWKISNMKGNYQKVGIHKNRGHLHHCYYF